MTPREQTIQRLDRLRSFSDLTFAPDGGSVLATVRRARGEGGEDDAKPHVYRFGLDGQVRQLTFGPTGEGRPGIAPGDGAVSFLSDRESKGKADLFVMEAGGEARRLGKVPGYVEDYRWSPDGKSAIVLGADRGVNGGAINGAMRLSWGDEEEPEVSDGRAKRRLMRIDRASGAVTEVGPDGLNIWEFELAGPDRAVAIVSEDASERGWHHAYLVVCDLRTRTSKVLHRPEWQIQGLAISLSGNQVAFTEGWSSDRGLVAGVVHIIDLETGADRTLAADTLSNVTQLSWIGEDRLWFAGWDRLGSAYGILSLADGIVWHEREDQVMGENGFVARLVAAPDGAGIAAVRETVGAPQEIYYRTREEGWRALTSFNAEVADGFPHYPEIRTISYTGRDGLELTGVLVLPRDRPEGPLPTIVDIHGGPCYSSKPQFNPSNTIPLASAGYAVFLPNYRGNLGWGQEFARLNVGDPAGEEFEDILRGIDAVVSEGVADAERLAVTGGSYGGYLTAWAVARTTRFKAAVMVAGIVNQLSCHYSCEHDFHGFINGGPLSEQKYRDVAMDRSAITHLHAPVTPTLIIHGREDRCTPLGQAQEFYAALREKGVDTELVVYPGAGHSLRKYAQRQDAARRRLAWFDRYLRNGP